MPFDRSRRTRPFVPVESFVDRLRCKASMRQECCRSIKKVFFFLCGMLCIRPSYHQGSIARDALLLSHQMLYRRLVLQAVRKKKKIKKKFFFFKRDAARPSMRCLSQNKESIPCRCFAMRALLATALHQAAMLDKHRRGIRCVAGAAHREEKKNFFFFLCWVVASLVSCLLKTSLREMLRKRWIQLWRILSRRKMFRRDATRCFWVASSRKQSREHRILIEATQTAMRCCPGARQRCFFRILVERNRCFTTAMHHASSTRSFWPIALYFRYMLCKRCNKQIEQDPAYLNLDLAVFVFLLLI